MEKEGCWSVVVEDEVEGVGWLMEDGVGEEGDFVVDEKLGRRKGDEVILV